MTNWIGKSLQALDYRIPSSHGSLLKVKAREHYWERNLELRNATVPGRLGFNVRT